MEKELPETYIQLMNVFKLLEKHFKDMQDIKFTVEDKKLFMLQTRNGKRTAAAAVRVAVEMVGEGLITKEEAIQRIDANSIPQLLFPHLDDADVKTKTPLATGLPASPGAAIGKLAFSADEVVKRIEAGEKELILAREEISPDDIEGMNLAKGIVTARGGMTSHAAVVARGMGDIRDRIWFWFNSHIHHQKLVRFFSNIMLIKYILLSPVLVEIFGHLYKISLLLFINA
jgi:pyruvate,orthophosphate dikinase